ncbi:MAG: hypothetical protein H6607_06965 [Flavobacteriales bacterium]|nr:hypothetical protein [Flavobacteriales bacterium]
MKAHIPYIVLFVVVLLPSCKPEEPEPWTRYEYLGEARDYIYFKPGTWWVYENIKDGRLDTIEITKSFDDTTKLTGNGNTMYYEEIEWYAKSRMDVYEYHFYSWNSPLIEQYDEGRTAWRRYYLAKYKPGGYVGVVTNFIYPFDQTYTQNTSTHSVQLKIELNILKLKSKEYQNIKAYLLSDDDLIFYDELERTGGAAQYYWAKNIGMIKLENLKHSVSWELIDYNIVQ